MIIWIPYYAEKKNESIQTYTWSLSEQVRFVCAWTI